MDAPLPLEGAVSLSEHGMDAPDVRSATAGTLAFLTCPSPSATGANEDSLGIVPVDGGGLLVIAVADGVGGGPLGSTASRLAIEAVSRAVADGDAAASVRDRILNGFELANRAVLGLGVGAATTLIVAEVTPETLRCYHTGDSAVVVVGQRGKVKLATVAHSPVGYGVEAGLLDPREAMNHDQRNVVSNLVGAPDMRVEIGSALSLDRRDTVVVGTDGLFDNMHVEEIIATIRRGPLGPAAAMLRDVCRARMNKPEADHPSKPDDLTFALFRPAPH